MVETNKIAFVAPDVDAIPRQFQCTTRHLARDKSKSDDGTRRGVNHFGDPFHNSVACPDCRYFASHERRSMTFCPDQLDFANKRDIVQLLVGYLSA
jgi:hypothetical protein